MRIARAGITVVLLAFVACVPPAVPPHGTMPNGEYVDREAGFRLTVPRGWGEAVGSGDSRERIRLRSSNGKAVVSVSVVSIGSSRCRIAIEEWLPKAHAAAFTTTVDRSVGISSRELPRVWGEIEALDGGSAGALSGFCDGDVAVIAVGLAKGASESAHRTEMESAVSSFDHLAPPEPTPAPTVKAPPARKKKPPVRPTRQPAPAPTTAPEPTAEAEPEPTERPEPTARPEPTPKPAPTTIPAEPTAAPEPADDEILPER